MLLAKVVGNVWGSRQATDLQGYRLLVCRPLTSRAAGHSATNATLEACAEHSDLETAARTVVAIVDQMDVDADAMAAAVGRAYRPDERTS